RLARGETVLGRGHKCGLRFDEEGISRKHARLLVDSGRVEREDLGSANGTLVNGTQITRVPLSDGDKIQIGFTTVLKFTYTDPLDESFQDQMYNAAMRDPLTGVFNRASLDECLEKELAYARRHNSSLSLVML